MRHKDLIPSIRAESRKAPLPSHGNGTGNGKGKGVGHGKGKSPTRAQVASKGQGWDSPLHRTSAAATVGDDRDSESRQRAVIRNCIQQKVLASLGNDGDDKGRGRGESKGKASDGDDKGRGRGEHKGKGKGRARDNFLASLGSDGDGKGRGQGKRMQTITPSTSCRTWVR